jgi:hypothetical protein
VADWGVAAFLVLLVGLAVVVAYLGAAAGSTAGAACLDVAVMGSGHHIALIAVADVGVVVGIELVRRRQVVGSAAAVAEDAVDRAERHIAVAEAAEGSYALGVRREEGAGSLRLEVERSIAAVAVLGL